MHWRNVKSSNIRKTAYDQGDMYIEFVNGRVYKYEGVPKETYADVIKSDIEKDRSVGKTFHKKIRGGYHNYQVKDEALKKLRGE